jgi:chitin disaccharide deacetylase
MLIINADDWGRNRTSTDNSMLCFKKGSITSASAMVFMADSIRAAELAHELGLDTGLHLNFTLEFDGNFNKSKLMECQQRIVSFLRRSKYHSLFYNPWLRKDFEYVYHAQYEEFGRLYNKQPTHIDGHHHIHLCTNMLVDGLIPRGSKVRRSFTFSPGEKNIFNIFYRSIVDLILKHRYICTDYFYGFTPYQGTERLQYIAKLSQSSNVELMVHPERQAEYSYLISEEYIQLISQSFRGSYVSM